MVVILIMWFFSFILQEPLIRYPHNVESIDNSSNVKNPKFMEQVLAVFRKEEHHFVAILENINLSFWYYLV